MNMFKRSMAVLLVLCMMLGAVPFTAFAAQDEAVEETAVVLSNEDDYARILHLDNGRKYFSAEWIKALINEMVAAGYNQLQLAFGNDGMRFLLDDMEVTVNGTTYDSETVKAGIQQGNRNYHDFGTNELTEAEMDEIITHANSMGIEIVPHVNMPGHMDAIVDAIEYVGISDAHFYGHTASTTSLNLNNDDAVAFAQALLQKYVDYFDAKGCKYFHIGADEYGNDAYNGNMGFPNMGATLYAKYADYVNDCAAIVKDAGMTPRAWNDGVSYKKYTEDFDTDIQITYWSPGWWGYDVASASDLNYNGHDMINTHGDYYYILGKDDRWTTSNTTTHDPNLYTAASGWSNNSFCGGSSIDSVGSMFCIWGDYPNFETEQQIAANVRLVLRAMAAEMQGGDANSISTEVVSGGFNEDGSINTGDPVVPEPKPEPVTKTDFATGVSVAALGLTDLTVTETKAPAVDTAVEGKVVAWVMIPETEDGAYKGSATVSVPVPEGWTNVRGGVLASDNGEAVSEIAGTLKDGVFTFKVPHFSTVYAYERDAANVTINLEVGGTHKIVIEGADYDGEIQTNPTGIASVVAEHEEVVGSLTETPVSSFDDGGEYYIQNSSGKYLTANFSWGEKADAVAWTATLHKTQGSYKFYVLSYNGQYAVVDYSGNISSTDNSNKASQFAWMAGDLLDATYYWDFKASTMSGIAGVNQSTITFTGLSSGTTYATIGDTVYKIVVTGTVPITIKYQTANGTLIKTETVNVAENATTYAVFNFTHTNGKFYVVGQDTIAITPETQTEYTVIVEEADEDLTQVDPLSIEYWQTNATVNAPEEDGDTALSVSAATAYSVNGVDLLNLIPQKGFKGSAPVNYWRSRLLPRATNEQTETNGDDETLNGTGFTKVRYWNGVWAVYTENGEWTAVNADEHQLVAYYMNDMSLADEINVGTSDWGKKGDGTFSEHYLGEDHVSISFQVVYEGGLTTAPATTTAADLAATTYLVDRSGTSGVGTITLNQIGDYQIWKVTAETGTHTTNYSMWGATTVTGFTWDDDNEMVVWEDEDNPVSQYTIQNPKSDPSTEGAYANLTWDEENEAILIRIYIKAVETEDSLKIVYYDEKFGTTLSEINVLVPSGSNFNDNIVKVSSGETVKTMPAFEGNSARVNAAGYGIVNALEKTQIFETKLANVSITNNRYNPDLYKYTGSVVSADGKILTHYYSIDQTALSPNLVADFGLPLTFPLSQVVGQGQGVMVADVTVKEKTSYGTLTYNEETEIFTYTPTAIMKGIDVLTINILFDRQTSATTTNVGVTPATTVYYEESFLNYDDNWEVDDAPTMTQRTEVIGQSSYYGYDPAYDPAENADFEQTAAESTATGATATFTFKGTGFELYANSTGSTGYVAVYSKGNLSKMYSINTKLQADEGSAFAGLSGTHYSLPIISETALPYGEYTVQIKQTKESGTVQIDGVRIINTIDESGKAGTDSIYYNDEEDKPVFHELRDYVLKSMNVETLTESDYVKNTDNERDSRVDAVEKMAGQVYNHIEGSSGAVIIGQGTALGSVDVQDLLDNGPKNELYLYPGQTLVFNVNTARVVQLGLKAPTGSVSGIEITVQESGKQAVTHELTSLSTTVDMFYKLVEKGNGTAKEYTVTVSVPSTAQGILSVTKVKICDDPGAGLTALSQEDLEAVLLDLYGLNKTKPTYTRPTWSGDWSAWLERQFDQWKDYMSGRHGKR